MQVGWQVFILLHALFSAFQALQFRAIARDKKARHAALAVNAIAFSTLYVCGVLILPILGEVSFKDFQTDIIPYMAASSLFVMALYLMYKAMTHLESATASVLGTSSALFAILFGTIIYNERLTVSQIVGMSILVPCVWYVLALARKHHKFFNFRDANWFHGFLFMLASSFCLALAHVIEKAILQTSSVGTYVAFGWLLQAGFAWLFYLLFGRHAKKVFRSNVTIRSSIQLGVVRAAAGLFFVLALVESDNVSLVTVVANFRIILVAILAGWLLGERKFYYKKIAAAAVSVIALSIIFWN